MAKGSSGRGTLTGSLSKLTKDERRVVNDLLAEGKDVEVLRQSNVPNSRTPDFRVDGIPAELKTLHGTSGNTPVTRITDAFKQGAQTVIIDARSVAMPPARAQSTLRRAAGIYGGSLPGRVEIWTAGGRIIGGV